MCGEHLAETLRQLLGGGSSPRVRGTHRIRDQRHQPQRFIPACAGNTNLNVAETRQQYGSSPRVRGTRGCWGTRSQPPSVHPRVCGEHANLAHASSSSAGSSPRVRGTRSDALPDGAVERFIPACAGNTSAVARASTPSNGSSPRVRGTPSIVTLSGPPRTVHPRVCGEHRRRAQHQPPRHRFIPACAGNTHCHMPPCRTRPVHPRVCGEHSARPTSASVGGGSSPRVRGTRPSRSSNRRRRRFIPAYAGNTARGPRPPRWAAVHPRVCGEHVQVEAQIDVAAGSSPRVRGTRLRYRLSCRRGGFIPACAGNTRELDAALAAAERFIPACAGNTSIVTLSGPPSTVHPRVCGEHHLAASGTDTRGGSSPRVRGTRLAAARAPAGGRFIPACAGNTSRARRPRPPSPVHPRVCGEHRAAQGGADGVRRFIPACAGNTCGRPHPELAGPVHPRVCGEH